MRTILEKTFTPGKKILKLCEKYSVDPKSIDFESMLQLQKDYSSEKAFLDEIVIPELKRLSDLDRIQVVAIEQPTEAELMQLQKEQDQNEALAKQKEIDHEYEAILEKIKTEPTPNIDKLTWEIQEWINLVLSDSTDTHTLFIKGPPGVGKTTLIKKVLKKNFSDSQLKKIIKGGHLTPLSYFCELYDNPNGLFYWNDLDKGFFNNETSVSLLKQSTDTCSDRKVDYGSTSPKLGARVPYCIFKGKQIFDINGTPKNEEFLTIISRSPPIEFKPTNKEIVIMMYEIIKTSYMEVELKEKIQLVDFIKRNVSEATKNFDLRKLQWFIDLYRHCGGMNDKFSSMSKALLKVDEGKELVLSLSKKKMTIDEQFKEYEMEAELKGLPKSRATFFNYRKEIGIRK